MNTIQEDDLFQNLKAFLKTKGVELKRGAYSHRVQQGCSALTEIINTTHKTVERAKAGIDSRLDQLRQTIHEKTAPRQAATQEPAPEQPQPMNPGPGPASAQAKRRQRKPIPTRRGRAGRPVTK